MKKTVKFCCSCGKHAERDLCDTCASKNGHIGYAYSSPYEYCFKPTLDHLGRPGEIKLGVELEYESWDMHACDNVTRVLNSEVPFVFVKKDASLQSKYSAEIVSVPASLQVHKLLWKRFFKALPGKTFKIAALRTCGMHVHIGRKELTNSQIGKMYSFVNFSHNADFIYAIAGRKNNRYSAVMSFRKYTNGFYNCRMIGFRGGNRYTALNLRPEKTIELRIFRSTMSHFRFFARLEFAHALATVCAPSNGLQNCIYYEKFLEWVIEREKDYPYLIRYLQSKNLINYN